MNHQHQCGLTIVNVAPRSAGARAGLKARDRITSINNNPISDELDYYFWINQPDLSFELVRRNKNIMVSLKRNQSDSLGISFEPLSVKRCGNKCVFCFVDQMPKGLRRGLYIKDEDYRHSFLNGNYITLSTIKPADLKRIVTMGLSPLFISVHATDTTIRNQLLGRPLAPDISSQLEFLQHNNIQFHTQIVVCPGINDGLVLRDTINRLMRLKKGLLSIAVVPVGLTRYHKNKLCLIDADAAKATCTAVTTQSNAFYRKQSVRKIFLADEFFIKAKRLIPPARYYEEYPQIENGVGLIRQLLDEWKKTKQALLHSPQSQARCNQKLSGHKVLFLTSNSAFQYIDTIIQELSKTVHQADFTTTPVPNLFLGATVTVAGLISAQDIIKTAAQSQNHWHTIVVPSIIFNYNGFTLDGYSFKRLQKALKARLLSISSFSELTT